MNGGMSFHNLRRGDVSGQGAVGGPFVSADLLPEALNIGRNCRFKNLKSKLICFFIFTIFLIEEA